MKSSFLFKSVVVASFLTLSVVGFLSYFPAGPKDPCQTSQLKVSQFEIGTKDKARLGLHMDHSFGSKMKKYRPYIKDAKSKVYFKKRLKNKPSLVSLTTDFKSKKSAKSAYKYLKRKWKNNKKSEYDVILKDNSVTWFRNSHATPQCFFKVVNHTKDELGIKQSQTVVAKKKVKKKSKRVASKKKIKKKRRLASSKK